MILIPGLLQHFEEHLKNHKCQIMSDSTPLHSMFGYQHVSQLHSCLVYLKKYFTHTS